MAHEMNKGKPYAPSPRIAGLRARVLDPRRRPVGSRWLREFYYLESWMAGEGRSLPVRTAEALAHVIENMPAVVHKDDLLAGEHGLCHFDTPLNFWPGPHLEACRRDIEAARLSAARRRKLLEWLGREPFAWQRLAVVDDAPPPYVLAHERGVIEVWGTDLNHSVRGYEKALRLGFRGLRDEVRAALEALEVSDPAAPHRGANLQGWLRLCEAAIGLGRRHAEAARRLARRTRDPELKRALAAMAQVCERVPAEPARTFHEAVQALWFAHMVTCWEDGVNANSIGRIDQFLWPYLAADLDEGRLTREDASELLAALWVKLYQPYDVQQMMIGGTRPDGGEAVNLLSFMALDVTEGLGFVRCLSARLHAGTPRPFVARCVDLLARGGGIPFLFNDDTLVPALTSKGIAPEDARDYAALGCVEITIPGRANPHAVSHWINLAKCLELALNDGCDLRDGAQVGPRAGSLAGFKSVDDVLRAYTAQLEHFARWAVYGSNRAELAHRGQFRLPYLSLLTDDCVSRGLDIIEGGARYNYHSSAAMGIPNVADSLTALDTAVFTEGRISPAAMLEALRENFAGREELRLHLRNRLPKYGNDEKLPDSYAARITRQYCELLGRFSTVSGGTFFCHLFTFTLMLRHGERTGASPDGRRAGEPLAYSVSPVQGRDREGLTAVLNSLSRLPHNMAAASSSAILEADPKLLEGAGRAAFTDLLITAIRNGVGQMQWNVVDAETLRAAQKDPDRYRNLCVRVSGFSQQFCLLDRGLQDHIIARTKHARR